MIYLISKMIYIYSNLYIVGKEILTFLGMLRKC